MTNWTIYRLVCCASGKAYIGITKTAVRQRWRRHINTAKRGSPIAISRAIRKYGEDAFLIEIIDTAADFVTAAALERTLIAKHCTYWPDGYNLTTGGEATMGRRVSAEARARMSEAAKRRKRQPDSPETRQRKSVSRLKAFKDHPHMRLAISRAQTGRKRTPAETEANRKRGKEYAAQNPEFFKELARRGRAARYGHDD